MNAYVIDTGERLLLVDTGGGESFAPTLGWLPKNLQAAGVDPAGIEAVLLTHIHPDHSNGLLDASGGKAFSNADVFVSAAEYDFWTDATHAAASPAAMKPFFDMARMVLRPYGPRLRLADGEELGIQGVRRLSAAGHTPDHCGCGGAPVDRRDASARFQDSATSTGALKGSRSSRRRGNPYCEPGEIA